MSRNITDGTRLTWLREKSSYYRAKAREATELSREYARQYDELLRTVMEDDDEDE